MSDDLSRRDFTGILSSAAVVTLAGCTSTGDGSGSAGGAESASPESTETPSPTPEPTETATATPESTETATPTAESTPPEGFRVPEDASVSIAEPQPHATIASSLSVVLDAENFAIEPAGEVNENAGHFHVIVDEGPVPAGEVIPADENHTHLDDGSKKTVLDVGTGEHKLTVQVGNGNHEAYPLSKTIRFGVTGEGRVSFEKPADGAEVASPVTVEMGSLGIDIEQAGEINQDAGHFHVIVDEDPVPVGEVIPDDDSHIHFGDGSTSGEIELEPGEHELTLQVGNGEHMALEPTDTITVTVTE